MLPKESSCAAAVAPGAAGPVAGACGVAPSAVAPGVALAVALVACRALGAPAQPKASRKDTVTAILSLEVIEARFAAAEVRLPGGRRAGLHP